MVLLGHYGQADTDIDINVPGADPALVACINRCVAEGGDQDTCMFECAAPPLPGEEPPPRKKKVWPWIIGGVLTVGVMGTIFYAASAKPKRRRRRRK